MVQVRAFGTFDAVVTDLRTVTNAHGLHDPTWTSSVPENGGFDPRTIVVKDASRTDTVLRKLEGLLMRQVLDAILPKGGMFGVKGGLTGDVYRSIVVDHIAEKSQIAVLPIGKSV
jgi:hypothetical protein